MRVPLIVGCALIAVGVAAFIYYQPDQEQVTQVGNIVKNVEPKADTSNGLFAQPQASNAVKSTEKANSAVEVKRNEGVPTAISTAVYNTSLGVAITDTKWICREQNCTMQLSLQNSATPQMVATALGTLQEAANKGAMPGIASVALEGITSEGGQKSTSFSFQRNAAEPLPPAVIQLQNVMMENEKLKQQLSEKPTKSQN